MKKINWISGLRGITALIIVCYHLQQLRPIINLESWDWALYQFFNMAPVVVAIFFILGGLLRSLGYWESIFFQKDVPNTRKILIDRWWRIAPVYYIALIWSFLWSIYILGYNSDMLISLFSGFFFLNWLSPMTFFPTIINGPLWFIGYDMMGYIFTVYMMIGLTKISKKYIIPAILMYIALFLLLHNIFISFPWPVGSGIVSVWFPYYNPFIFALYFIMGISIGWIITYFQNIQKTIIADIVFLCSVGCVGIFLWFIRGVPDLAYSYPISPYRFPLVPILWVFAIVSIIYSRYIWLWIDNRILLWLATVSYSLYLWHGLIISIILQIFSFQISTSFIDWSIFSILSLVISFWFAALSARYIESIKRK